MGNLLDKAGREFTAEIYGEELSGKIQVEKGRVYLCQDVRDGDSCMNKLGYDHSWVVGIGEIYDLENNDVKNFKLVPSYSTVASSTKTLPKYWGVMNDGSDEYFSTVINYLNKTHGSRYSGDGEGRYYGWNNNVNTHHGCFGNQKPLPKENNPVLLTLHEFTQLINNKSITQTNQIQNYEEGKSVKVQRKNPTITGGQRFSGISTPGRVGKVAIAVGHLSHKAVSC